MVVVRDLWCGEGLIKKIEKKERKKEKEKKEKEKERKPPFMGEGEGCHISEEEERES